jgi:hypothetical protein
MDMMLGWASVLLGWVLVVLILGYVVSYRVR